MNVTACYNVEFTIDYCSHEDPCSKWNKRASKGLIHTTGKTFREGECVCVGGGGGQSREVWLVVSHSRGLKNLTLFMKVDLVNFEINRVKDTFILRWWNKGDFCEKKIDCSSPTRTLFN